MKFIFENDDFIIGFFVVVVVVELVAAVLTDFPESPVLVQPHRRKQQRLKCLAFGHPAPVVDWRVDNNNNSIHQVGLWCHYIHPSVHRTIHLSIESDFLELDDDEVEKTRQWTLFAPLERDGIKRQCWSFMIFK